MKEYKINNPLAQLKNANNMVSIKSEMFPGGIEISGAGAGANSTVFGIISDIDRLSLIK